VFIAGFTIILSRSTTKMWRVSTKQSEIAERTLDLARDEFRASHRPEITVHSVEFRYILTEKDNDRIGASILCFNKGRAAAQNVEVRADILVMKSVDIDVLRHLIKTIPEIPSGIKLRFEVKSERPVREIPQFLQQGTRYYCIGTIAYLDQNQTRRETGFCFVIKEPPSPDPRWVSAESRAHEYAY
jgi:hypothetical protein